MRKNVKKQIRLSEELMEYINDHYDNASQFIREAIREKVEHAKQTQNQTPTFVEIRAKNQYTFSAKLDHVIDGDTLALIIDLGFYLTINAKIRLADIDCPETDSEKGKQAKAFVEQELSNAHLIIETRKKGRYGRILAYIYYSTQYDDFEGIIRNGKMINDELIKVGLAEPY
jgi:endonuclease YncB( thermonuclease family)